MQRLGIGYRKPLHDWIFSRPTEIGCIEVTAEHFFDDGEETLAALARDYPVFVHGLGLSLGTPGQLCQKTLEQFARVAKIAKAQWVSEHIAFTRSSEVDLGHLNPLPRNQNTLSVLADHAMEVADRCGRPLILENITTSLELAGEMAEPEFLNRLCEQANCGLLLDVTNLFINSRNLHYDPLAWLHEIQPANIVQLHIVGYSKHGGRYHDQHAAPIQPDLLELLEAVLDYSQTRAVILERDDRLEETEEIIEEMKKLEPVVAAN